MNPQEKAGADRTRIEELVHAWARAVRATDIDGILAHHSRDILLFDVVPPLQSKGIEAYRRSWEVFFPWFKDRGAFEVHDLEVTAGSDVGYCHGLIRCAGTEPGGRHVDLEVRLTICLRKVDGQWTVTHEHHSEPSPTGDRADAPG